MKFCDCDLFCSQNVLANSSGSYSNRNAFLFIFCDWLKQNLEAEIKFVLRGGESDIGRAGSAAKPHHRTLHCPVL